MKVYFDEDGQLKHLGCNGHILADVEVWYHNMPITDEDGLWDLGEFEADIELHPNGISSSTIRHVKCDKCHTMMMSSADVKGLELITKDKFHDAYVEWLLDQLEKVVHNLGCSLNSDIFYEPPPGAPKDERESVARQLNELRDEYDMLHGLVSQLINMEAQYETQTDVS